MKKKSLIAVVVAGALASGAAVAERLTIHVDGQGAPLVRVQQYDRDDFRRWYDEGRRLDVDDRQARIHDRIQRGFDRGQLTRREVRQLERQLNDVEAKERAYQSDGRLNRRERDDLHQDLDRLADRLRFERRDGQTRY
jgi:hypothetical protein